MNIPTACSDSTSQKVQISLFCPMPMSKGSRINSTHAPERYSATEPLVRFSSTPTICPLHFTVEWAKIKSVRRSRSNGYAHCETRYVVSEIPKFMGSSLADCHGSGQQNKNAAGEF